MEIEQETPSVESVFFHAHCNSYRDTEGHVYMRANLGRGELFLCISCGHQSPEKGKFNRLIEPDQLEYYRYELGRHCRSGFNPDTNKHKFLVQKNGNYVTQPRCDYCRQSLSTIVENWTIPQAPQQSTFLPEPLFGVKGKFGAIVLDVQKTEETTQDKTIYLIRIESGPVLSVLSKEMPGTGHQYFKRWNEYLDWLAWDAPICHKKYDEMWAENYDMKKELRDYTTKLSDSRINIKHRDNHIEALKRQIQLGSTGECKSQRDSNGHAFVRLDEQTKFLCVRCGLIRDRVTNENRLLDGNQHSFYHPTCRRSVDESGHCFRLHRVGLTSETVYKCSNCNLHHTQ